MAKPKEPLMRDELLKIAQTIIKKHSDQRAHDHYLLIQQGLQQAISLVLSPEVKNVLTHPIFNKIPPYEIFEHFTKHGWPAPDGQMIWVETPALLPSDLRQSKTGIMVIKRTGKPQFDLSIFTQAKIEGLIEGRDRKKAFSAIKDSGLWDKVYSLCTNGQEAIRYYPVVSFASFDESNALITDTNTTDHMAYAHMASSTEPQKLANNVKAEYHQTALLMLRLFLVMSKVGPHLTNTQAGAAPKTLSLGQKFFSGFNELKEADDLRRFFGLPDQATRDDEPILHRIKGIYCPEGEKSDEAAANAFLQKANNSRIVLYERTFHDLAVNIARNKKLEDLRDILIETGLGTDRLWFEGPFLGSPDNNTTKSSFIRRVGCLVESTGASFSLQFAHTLRARANCFGDQYFRLPETKALVDLSVVNVVKKTETLPYTGPVIVDTASESEKEYSDAYLRFLVTGLILTRMRQINLEEAGLLVPSRRTARQTNDEKTIRFKFPYIGQQKDKDGPTVLDVTKPNSGKSSSSNRPFVLSQESIAWEEAKTHARELVGDVLNEDNHGQLFCELDKTAKEMFGAGVTVAISRVQESKVMYGRVSGVPYRYPEHIRIDLVYERDGHYGELRQAAYLLTAKSASQDGRQLELSVRDGNVTLKPKSSDLGMT